MKYYIVCFFLLIQRIMFVQASPQETLPTYHWVYDYLDELQERGLNLELWRMNKPYTRQEIALSLHRAEQDTLHGNESILMNQLKNTLSNQFIDEFPAKPSEREHIHFQTNVRSDVNAQTDGNPEYRGIYRFGVGAYINDALYAYSGFIFNQYDYYDPSYTGYKWRRLVGYTEQAYINVTWKNVLLKIGRDFVKWGGGKNGSLILSDVAQPLDQVSASVTFGPARFTFLTSELDEFYNTNVDSISLPVKRYLTGHRLDMRFWGGRIQAAISELLIYGGVNESFKLAYVNPVIFYKGEHKNGASQYGNILPTVDVLIYPFTKWQLYSALLIDDIQLEKTQSGDLEPNEIGWIAGTTWADPCGIIGLTCNLEYARVANRTYKTPYLLESFIHRGKPLGHPLGNDFYLWNFDASYWLTATMRLNGAYSRIRKGEGSIYSPWDAPWFNYTLDQGYEEPFSSGIVEKSNIICFGFSWYVKNWLRVYSNFRYSDIMNSNHERGNEAHDLEWMMRLEFDWSGDVQF